MSKKEFEDKMYQILEDVGIEVKEKFELEADSLQYITLISTIEEIFEIELPDEFLEFSVIQNVESFIDSVYELVK